jgi:Fe2+ or Zn2+ uptake regulation protein
MITKEQFNDEAFYRERSTKKQALFLNFLLKNKTHAFKTQEIAKEIYGKDDAKNTAKAYYVLCRLYKRGYVEKKMPYWTIKQLKEKRE